MKCSLTRATVLAILMSAFQSCDSYEKPPESLYTPLISRKVVYDEKYKHDLSILEIDQQLISTLSEGEKAAIVYLATGIGNDCYWENDNIQRNDNLKCKFISAFELGYQCSPTHLDFLRKWFGRNERLMKQLENCPVMPRTSTSLSGFYNMFIAKYQDLFFVKYDGFGIGTINKSGFEWSAEIAFKIIKDQVIIIDFNETPFRKAKIDLKYYMQVHVEFPK